MKPRMGVRPVRLGRSPTYLVCMRVCIPWWSREARPATEGFNLTDCDDCRTFFVVLWEFTPLTAHYDFGLGAMADSFEDAADCIEKAVVENKFLNWPLPICFLRRHAIELFLKSMLVILDRRFAGVSKLEEVRVSVKDKPKPLTTIHSIGELYDNLKARLVLYEEKWQPICSTDWLSFPVELDSWIAEIEEVDGKGTFFRYPDSGNSEGDEAKSMFKKSSVEEILASISPDSIPRHTVIVGDDDTVTEVYTENRDAIVRELEALRGATTLLSAANFGLRTELAGGR